MLTPQEVSERVFPKASFGGYNMSQVDEFLDLLTEDYSTLYSENALLKSKMKVLVDKVEEYRSTETAMRKALMTAQRMADETVKEAEQRRDEILQEAMEMAAAQVEDLRRQCQEEEFRLQSAKLATQDYLNQVRQLYTAGLEFLDSVPELAPQQPAAPQVEQPAEDAADEIDENVQRLLAQAMDDVAKGNLPEEEPAQEKEGPTEDDAPALSRIDFGNLQFGRDYQIQ